MTTRHSVDVLHDVQGWRKIRSNVCSLLPAVRFNICGTACAPSLDRSQAHYQSRKAASASSLFLPEWSRMVFRPPSVSAALSPFFRCRGLYEPTNANGLPSRFRRQVHMGKMKGRRKHFWRNHHLKMPPGPNTQARGKRARTRTHAHTEVAAAPGGRGGGACVCVCVCVLCGWVDNPRSLSTINKYMGPSQILGTTLPPVQAFNGV